MKINHCNNDFKAYDVWFLYDNAAFKNRRLLLGKCPVCKKDVCCLVEERKADAKIFIQKETGMQAVKLIDDAIDKKDVVYTSKSLRQKQGNGAPFGLCYGQSKEIHNNKGEIVGIKINRCDFYGQKETIQDGSAA